MESGRSQDPGVLSLEDELTLLELDKAHRNTHAHEIISSREKEWTFYLMEHRPPGPADKGSPDYNPNHYMFFVMGPKGESINNKVFILFLDEANGNYVRVINIDGLRAQHEAQGLDEDQVVSREFWKTVELQAELGSAVPNHEDMEDFTDIVSSWRHAGRKPS